MKKIYLASRYHRRPDMAVIADYLEDRGFEITARWVKGGEEGLDRDAIARLDFEDVTRADICLSFTEPRGSVSVGGGRHTEFGIAYALGKQCDIIGEREQVFHHLPNVIQYDDLADWLAHNK